MAIPQRRTLHANIGQWGTDVVADTFVIPSQSYFVIQHSDVLNGYGRGNQFEEYGSPSYDCAFSASIFSIDQTIPFFLRRFRVQSAQAQYGLKIWNKQPRPNVYATPTSGFKLNLRRGVNTVGQSLYNVWTTNETVQFNEWQDVNELFYPASTANLSADYRLALSEFYIGIDATDVPSRLVGAPLDVQVEIEIDS
jgi:hypothetical protein